MFDSNSGFLYAIVAIVLAFVIAESIVFFVKAWKRGKALNMDMGKLKKLVVSSAIFTIAPAIAILMGVLVLSKALGLPIPWLRLSVIGALTYEVTAAETAAVALGQSISQIITDKYVFSSIVWVMTLGIMPSVLFVPIFAKSIDRGMNKLKSKDARWGELLVTALFLGMISAFLGVVFAKTSLGLVGWIPVFVMIIAALIMAIMGLLIKKLNLKGLQDFALPISMLGAMALSIPLTRLIESAVGG